MSTYRLIIQGPIRSNGMTGANYKEFYQDRDKKHIVNYDCIPNINRLLKEFGSLFEAIVISTWEGEPIGPEDLEGDLSRVQLLRSKDTTQHYINPKHPNGQIGLLKQFYSMQLGLEAFQGIGPDDYVVKVRTDQYLDLGLLLQEHRAFSEVDRKKKIFVPAFSYNTIIDFYFVATCSVMTQFCESILQVPAYPQINVAKTSVHHAIPCAYCLYLEKKASIYEQSIFLKSLAPVFERLDTTLRNCAEAKSLVDFIALHFESLSAELIYGMDWRGGTMAHNPAYQHALMRFDDPSPPRLNGFNFFLYLGPETYFQNKGKRNGRALCGLLNFMLLSKVGFYRKLMLKRYHPLASQS